MKQLYENADVDMRQTTSLPVIPFHHKALKSTKK